MSFTPEFEIGEEIFNRLVFAAIALLEIINIVIVEPFKLAKFYEKRTLRITLYAWRKRARSHLIELFNGFVKSASCWR